MPKMIRVLTSQQSISHLLQILEQLRLETVRDGTYEIFFTDLLPIRRLIYPCDYELTSDLVAVLERVMQKSKDTGCFIDVLHQWTYLNREGQEETTPSCYCYVSLDQFRYAIDGNGIAIALMNKDNPYIFVDSWSMYSEQKRWGLHVDGNGKYALLAGTAEVINIFDEEYPLPATVAQDFLDEWRWRGSCDKQDLEAPWNWLTRLMIHVYGEEQGIQIMEAAGMFQ